MNTYAMVANKIVIDVVSALEAPQWPPTTDGHEVTAIQCDLNVERGMLYDSETGSFSMPPDTEPPETPVDDEKSQLDRIEEKLDAIAEGAVNQELEQYYATVNAALTGGV